MIINEKIKDLLKTIFEIDSEEKYFISVNCLFKSTNKTLNDSFISIFYSLKDSSLINVGNFYGKEFLYETNILFEINDKKYFDELLTKKELNTNLEKKIESLFDNNNKDDEKYLKLENENKAEIGIAYLIKINENKVQKIDTSLKTFLFKDSKAQIENKDIKISDELEKDIKILIKYILFKKELNKAYNCSKVPTYYKKFSNCFLINILVFYKYKSYKFYEKLMNLVEEESKNLKPINNSPISLNEPVINKIYSSLIKLFISNKELYDEKQINSVASNLNTNIQNCQIIMGAKNLNEKTLDYPDNFEIIDQFVFDDMKIRFDNMQENNYLKCDIIVNNERLLIKCDNKKEILNNIIILIGHLATDSFFNLKKLINFSNANNRNEFFESFAKDNYINLMNKYLPYLNSSLSFQNLDQKVKLIDFNDSVMNFDEKHIGDKLIKFFLFLYLFENDINQDLKTKIVKNGVRVYYFINKQWMAIYKRYYDYKNLCYYFDGMKNEKSFSYNYKNLLDCINKKDTENANKFICELIKKIPKETLNKIESSKRNQTILIQNLNNKLNSVYKKTKIINNINIEYLAENTFISENLYKLFTQLESAKLNNLIKMFSERRECLIGENKLYIKSEINKNSNSNNYSLNVGYIKDYIFTSSLIINYYNKNDFEQMLSQLNTSLFSLYIEYFNLIDNSSCDIKNSLKETVGKVFKVKELEDDLLNIIKNANKINPDSMKLLKLIIYFKKFNKEKTLPFKSSEESICYYVKTEFMDEIKKISTYKIIEDYINKNKDIEEIINNNRNKNLDSLSIVIEKKFNTDQHRYYQKN